MILTVFDALSFVEGHLACGFAGLHALRLYGFGSVVTRGLVRMPDVGVDV